MAIQVASPNDGIDAVDDDSFKEDDSTAYNFRELMDLLIQTPDVILTVPSDQVPLLKAGLVTRKSKDNAKLKASGLIVDNNVLAFIVYPPKDENGVEIPGQMCVRVKLQPKKNVNILKIEVPSEEF